VKHLRLKRGLWSLDEVVGFLKADERALEDVKVYKTTCIETSA
jgi:hypothetical protein